MPGKITAHVRWPSPGATLAWAEGLVLVLCLFNVSYRIDTSKIGEWDEARYGVSAFEMLVMKDLWVNTYAYERDFANLKPPLGLWAIGASYALVGVTPLGLRLPSMLAGVLCVWVTIRLGRRVGGPPVGVLAGAILATAFPFILRHGARTGNFDVLLTLLITLALWLTSAWPWRPATAGLLGLVFAAGFLVKSWAVGPFALAAFLYILATQGRAALGATIPSVSVAGLLPITCWASVRGMRDGPEFLQRMVTYDLLHRATDTVESASPTPFYYVAFLGDRFAPWAELLVIGMIVLLVKRAGQAHPFTSVPAEKNGLLLLACWSVLPLALLSLAGTRYHWYSIPILPALALATAWVMTHLFRLARQPPLQRLILTVIVLGLALNEYRILTAIRAEQQREGQEFLRTMPLPPAATICAFRPWTQRERWILAASRGAILCQLGAVEAPLPAHAQGVLLLIDRGAPEEGWIAGDRRFRVVESPDYLVATQPPDGRGTRGADGAEDAQNAR
jgi:4-amino-4-deoxy-L-arabinose transferase-like glycosyltransferase